MCFSFFLLPSVIKCLELQQPTRGSIKCSNPQGPSSYGSTCEFACDEGYALVGSSTLQCEASGLWSSSQPLCVGMSASTDVKTQRDSGEEWNVSHADLFRFSPLQPSSVPSFTGWRTAPSAAERTQTRGSATEAPAASPVAPATFWQGRARRRARQRQSGTSRCLAAKVSSFQLPFMLFLLLMFFIFWNLC